MRRKTDRPTSSKTIEQTLRDAYDFDPRDPFFGLTKAELSGPTLPRRSVLRLMAATGTLTAWHLMPGSGIRSASAQSGGELRCGWSGVGEIRTLDPAQINQVLQFQITSNVLGGLMHVNPDLVAEGDLAQDWSVSDDGKEWTFNLREGLTFHNGDPFTADDVLFTYNRSKDPEQSIHGAVISNVLDVVKVDDHTVTLVLGAPQASLLTKTLERSSGRAMTIVSKGALESMGPEQYGLTPVGTGPFKVVSHTIGQPVVLERFENYYDPERPKLDKVTIIPILEPEPLGAAIEAGDIQLIGGAEIAFELLDRFEANPDLVVDIGPSPGFQSLWMNPHRDPFKVEDFNKPLDELMQENGFTGDRMVLTSLLVAAALAKPAAIHLSGETATEINSAEPVALPVPVVVDKDGIPVKKQPLLEWTVVPTGIVHIVDGVVVADHDGNAVLRVLPPITCSSLTCPFTLPSRSTSSSTEGRPSSCVGSTRFGFLGRRWSTPRVLRSDASLPSSGRRRMPRSPRSRGRCWFR